MMLLRGYQNSRDRKWTEWLCIVTSHVRAKRQCMQLRLHSLGCPPTPLSLDTNTFWCLASHFHFCVRKKAGMADRTSPSLARCETSSHPSCNVRFLSPDF
jgi:hypothetical protein